MQKLSDEEFRSIIDINKIKSDAAERVEKDLKRLDDKRSAAQKEMTAPATDRLMSYNGNGSWDRSKVDRIKVDRLVNNSMDVTFDRKKAPVYSDKDIKFAKVNDVVYRKKVNDLNQNMKYSQNRHEAYAKGGNWQMVKKEREIMSGLSADLKKYNDLINANNKTLGKPIAIERVYNAVMGSAETTAAAPGIIAETGKTAMLNAATDYKNEELQALNNKAVRLKSQLGLMKNGYINVDESETDGKYMLKVSELNDTLSKIQKLKSSEVVDPNSKAMTAMRQAQATTANATVGLTGASKVLAETGVSILDNGMLLPLAAINPAIPLTVMGAKAAAGKTYGLNERGIAPGQALMRGIAGGVIEASTEKMGLDNLFKTIKSGGKGVLVNVLRQGGIEATEEGLSYAMNYVADNAYKDPNAEFDVKDFAMSVLQGGLSGLFFGVGGETVSSGINKAAVREQEAYKAYAEALKTKQTEQTKETQNIKYDYYGREIPQSILSEAGDYDAFGRKIDHSLDPQAYLEPIRSLSTDNNLKETNNIDSADLTQTNNIPIQINSGEIKPAEYHEKFMKNNRTIEYKPTMNELINKQSAKITKINTATENRNLSNEEYNSLFKEVRAKIKSMPWFNTPLFNKDTEFSTQFGELSARVVDKTLKKNRSYATQYGIEQIEIMESLPRLFENGKIIDMKVDEKGEKGVNRVITLLSPIQFSSGKIGVVKLNVKENTDSNAAGKIHENKILEIVDYKIIEDTSSTGLQFGSETKNMRSAEMSSTISVEEMLSFVKGDDLKYLPNDTTNNSSLDKTATGSAEGNHDSLKIKADQYGYLPPGEEPRARQAIVPKTLDNSGKKTGRHVRTAIEAEATTDDVANQLERDILDGKFAYEPINDKKANSYAQTVITNKGFNDAMNIWRGVVESERIPTKNEIALGERLYIEACHAGDIKMATRLIAEISIAGTRAGQTVQAMRLLKKLSPEGQLYYLQKTVESIKKNYKNLHYLEKTVGNIKKNRRNSMDIEINKDMAKELLNAKTTEEIELAAEKIKQDIADQLPSSWTEKWNAWRYLSMLGNPRTHGRNIAGNGVFQPAIGLKNVIGMGIESAYGKAKGLDNRTKSILTKKDKALVEFGEKDYDSEMKDFLTGTGKMNTQSEIESRKRIFDLKALEWCRKTNFAVLEAEDNTFLKLSYSRSLAQYMKSNGHTADYYKSFEGLQDFEKARRYASNEALRATYRDENKIVNALNNFRNTNRKTEVAMDTVLPFRKTPVNILQRGIDYSPVGFFTGTKQLLFDVKRGDKTANEAIDLMASGLSGTGIAALGFFLASKGLLKGGLGDEKEDKLKQATGEQEYALQLGNKSYTIDWMAPVSLPLFVGAELCGLMQEDADIGAWEVAEALSKITEPMFNLSMLNGINNIIKTARYSDNPITDILTGLPKNYISQGVPTVLGQMARTIDDTRRTTYTDKNKEEPAVVQQFVQGVQSKIPIASQSLEPRLDVWGRENVSNNIAVRAFQNFLSPGYMSTVNETEADKEIKKVYADTNDNSVIPSKPDKYFSVNNKRYDLNAKEYTQLVEAANRKSLNDVMELVNIKEYTNLSSEDKTSVISKVYEYNRAIARKAINEDYELKSNANTLKYSKEMGISSAQYILYNNELKDMHSDKDIKGDYISPDTSAERNGEGKSASLKKKEAIDSIKGLNEKQREILYDANGVSEKLWKPSK